MTPSTKAYLHSLLVLGRVSNLPTVWSNCLAGWWLGGGGSPDRLPALLFAASAIYLGGMFLNDAMDVDFDRRHRSGRPIPSGRFSIGHAWAWGLGLLAFGVVLLGFFNRTTLILGLYLAAAVIIYDVVHKAVLFSPVIMAACRFFLLLVAASVGDMGVTGLSLWSALALALYIIGLSYLAKAESQPGLLRYWPCAGLAAPLVLAALVNAGEHRQAARVVIVVAALWICRALRHTFATAGKNVGRTVADLLSGIVLTDLLALGGGPPPLAMALGGCFVLALTFQRFIPAT